MATSQHTHELFLSQSQNSVLAATSFGNDGSVTVELSKPQDIADRKSARTPFRTITTTAENCSFNVYASPKPPKLPQHSTRARLVSTSSDGQTVRIGNQIFLPVSKHDMSSQKPFSPKDFSLCLDHVEQHGRYVLVTSRQKVKTVPNASDQTTNSAAMPGMGGSTGQPKTSDGNATNSSEVSKNSPDASDASDDASVEPDSDPSIDSEGLSAYESCSEASTEYSEDEIVPELRPRPAVTSIGAQVAPEQSNDAAIYTSASDDGSEDDDDASTTSTGTNDSSPEPSTTRHTATAMDQEEDNRMFDIIFTDDRDGPASDAEGEDDEYPPDEFFEDDGYNLFGDDEDFDGFQAIESDSEECEECDDGGVSGTCALPSDGAATRVEAGAEEKEESEPSLGMPTAEIHVYDTQNRDEDGYPERVFRYTTLMLATPPLNNSLPSIHPTKSLLVWPLGDSKLLFADYMGNTYFTRKIRLSRMWSTHVSITPVFSRDGQYLHVAVVEKQGRLPLRPRKGRSGQAQAQKKQAAKKEPSNYELVVLTYRLSRGKTSRAPPMLVHRELVDLGSSRDIPPSCVWSNDELFVSCTSDGGKLEVYNIGITTPEAKRKSRRAKSTPQTPTAAVQRLLIQLPVWAAAREVQYLPNDRTEGRAPIILANAPQYLKLVRLNKPDAHLTTSQAIVGQNSTGDLLANVESDHRKEPATIADSPSTSSMERKEEKPGDEAEAPARAAIKIAFLAEGDDIGAWFVNGKERMGKTCDLRDEARWVGVCK